MRNVAIRPATPDAQGIDFKKDYKSLLKEIEQEKAIILL